MIARRRYAAFRADTSVEPRPHDGFHRLQSFAEIEAMTELQTNRPFIDQRTQLPV
jgi:hypothetical protein